jgi:hypothetical protein
MGRSIYFQPEPEYRKASGESQSVLKHILQSPAHYQCAKSRKFSPSPVMELGTAVHCKALEGDKEFEKRYVLKPEGLSLATTKGKEWRAQQDGKTPLSKTDQLQSWHAVHGMTESLRRLEWFDPRQEDYHKYNEVSIYWNQQGIECKARIDRLLVKTDRVIVLDVKTTDCAHPSVFHKKIFGGLNYLFQSGWYTEGASAAYDLPAEFVFVAVERTAPYNCAVISLDSDAIEESFRQTMEARRRLRRCLEEGRWDPPGVESTVMGLPRYFKSPIEEFVDDGYIEDMESIFAVPDVF